MKKIIYITGLITFLALTTACEQQDVLRYDPDRAAIEFPATGAGNTVTSSTFSFRSLPLGETETTLYLTFNIVGFSAPIDRQAVITVHADSTTATSEHFEIVSAIVPANSYQGQLAVRVMNNQGVDFQPVRIWFRTAPGGDFQAPGQSGPGYNNRILHLTNGLVRPTEWPASGTGTVNLRLGAYSTAFYAFIIEKTGVRRFPFVSAIAGYNLNDNDEPQVWTPSQGWMVLHAITTALEEYNREQEEQGLPVLHHDDGHAAGRPVIVGELYRELL